jgi:hypothetical protein
MKFRFWRQSAAAPLVALLALAGGGVAVLASSATSAGAAIPVTTEAAFRTAWANDANVTLGANITLTCVPGVGNGASEAVRNLAGAGTLDGQGFTITQTCPDNRVLQITGQTGAMTISNVTITGGQAVFGTFSGNGGGGIQVTSSQLVTLENSTLTNNFTCEGGGGIELDGDGPFTAMNSTISNNQSLEEGGGVVIYSESPMIVTNSTITGNTDASDAGGIGAGGGLTLTYSDVTNNTFNPNLTIAACVAAGSTGTDAHNQAHAAAGGDAANINTYGTSLTAFADVVTGPTGATNCDLGTGGATTSSGYNFADDTSCGFTDTTDHQVAAANPMLGALAANGGPTNTLLPQTGSPLIDAIPNAACQTGAASGITTDQRGFTRPEPVGGNCDIGAVEVQPVAPTPPPAAAPAAVVLTPHFTG